MARNRIAIIFLGIVLIVLAVVACVVFPQKVPDGLIGEWNCNEEAEGSDHYFGYYQLTIERNGKFCLYDAEAGNPGIAGKMQGDRKTTSGTLELICKKEDFDPPVEWTLQPRDTIQFEVVDENTMKLGQNDVWLIFTRDK